MSMFYSRLLVTSVIFAATVQESTGVLRGQDGEWKGPRGFAAPRVSKPIEIDGDIYKSVWEEVPWSEDFGDIQGVDAPKGAAPTDKTRSRMKMRWDDDYLYVAAEMSAQDWPILAEFTKRNEPIYQKDSDFEIFVDADESTHNYKEFEVNAKNTVWNLLLDKSYGDGGGEHSARIAKEGEDNYWDVKGQKSATKMYGELGKPNSDGKWTLEVKLLHSDSIDRTGGKKPTVGKYWRINFSRVEKKGAINWVWSPQMVWDPVQHRHTGVVAMHNPDVWGYVAFVEEGAANVGPGWVDPQWHLKKAASQVFYAQKYAASKDGGGKILNAQQLFDKGLIEAKAFDGVTLEVNTANGEDHWAATLTDGSDGCVASTRWDHQLNYSCSSAVAGPGLLSTKHITLGLVAIALVAMGVYGYKSMNHLKV